MISREDRLEFCKVCKNQKMDLDKGLLCGLTNEYADFEAECQEFEEYDKRRIQKLIRDLDATGHHNASQSLDPQRNKTNGAWIFIIGVIVLFVSINYMDRLRFFIIPVGLILFGARTFLKGIEQDRVLDKNDEFENKKRKT